MTIALCLGVLCASYAQSLPAFPGAEGFGANTVGGRNGRLIFVTNTNNSGPGSLRSAVDVEEPRTIVFKTSGIIDLLSPIVIKHPYVTIAGQSSPGKGICLRGNTLVVNSHDVVLRYLRVRPGDIEYDKPKNWDAVDGITIMNPDLDRSVYNIIVDHCSISWAVDENVGIWHDSHDITIQHSIISEALNSSKHPKGPNHSMGMLIGHTSTNLSIHHNLFVSNNDRNPLIISRDILIDFESNIIYNPGSIASAIITNNSERQRVNYVGNIIIQGPSTTATVELSIKGARTALDLYTDRNFFARASTADLYPARVSGQENLFSTSSFQQTSVQSQRHNTPRISGTGIQKSLIKSLSGLGASLPVVDEVDESAIDDLLSQKGRLISQRSSEFNWPRYDIQVNNEPDIDNDGMFDSWEILHGLDTTLADHNRDHDNDLYSNIEEFLNGTNPKSASGSIDMSYLVGRVPKVSSLPEVKIYPNPAGSSANIDLDVPYSGHVLLYLVDISGKKREVLNEYVHPGVYKLDIDLEGVKEAFVFSCIVQGTMSNCQKLLINN